MVTGSEKKAPVCVHHWTINAVDGRLRGICQKCKAEREFPWEPKVSLAPWRAGALQRPLPEDKPEKEGDMTTTNEDSAREVPRPKGRLTAKLRQELLDIGPEAFGQKYGYRHLGMLKAVYAKGKRIGQPSVQSLGRPPSLLRPC